MADIGDVLLFVETLLELYVVFISFALGVL